jgi:UDP-N-acetylmuramate: L-alanyl-gamma-D-glutamyl-meso-diaminopimelate ligase
MVEGAINTQNEQTQDSIKGRYMSTAELNANPRCIHLIAVCGTAMGALACMLKEMGYRVTGSDRNIYPPMSCFLEEKGIPVFAGFEAGHLGHRPDLVVVGNAVSRDNPEVRAMQDLSLPYCSMPQAINRFAARGKKQIVVAGTHGKTTTSAMIAWLFQCAGLDPSFLIGGIVSNFKSNYKVGKGEWMVLEGDEYDTAFFDKGPKFLHYSPTAAVLTSVEFDHADIFNDLDHVKCAFRRFIQGLNADTVLACYDRDANIAEILPTATCRTVFYGHDRRSDWRLGSVHIEPPLTRFQVFRKGRLFHEFKTPMIGEHNLCNLMATVAVGHAAGLDAQTMSHAFETFQGARRRQEIRGIKNDIIVIDDFAHHPTAVRATVGAVKSFYGTRRLIAVFEPRTNSSRRKIFQGVYPQAFQAAEWVCVREAPMLEKIPEGQRFSSRQLVDDLIAMGKRAFYFQDTQAIIDFLVVQTKPSDVILIMSNGGFDDIHTRLLAQLPTGR